MRNFTRRILPLCGAMLAFTMSRAAPADNAEEKRKLEQCAKQICRIIVSKDMRGPDFSCDLTKTWEKDAIQKGADSKNLAWGFGRAKCSAKVRAKRADLVASLTAPEGRLKIGKQPVACEIGAERYPISATLAPELRLKRGTVVSAALDMDDIEGAALIKGVVWTAAMLERHFGIFESDLVREVNRFIQKECPRIVQDEKGKK